MHFSRQDALNAAIDAYRSLASSANSKSWKRLPAIEPNGLPRSAASGNSAYYGKGKGRDAKAGTGIGQLGSIVVHRKSAKGADIVRATAELQVFERADIQDFKAVLHTPEIRANCQYSLTLDRNIRLMYNIKGIALSKALRSSKS